MRDVGTSIADVTVHLTHDADVLVAVEQRVFLVALQAHAAAAAAARGLVRLEARIGEDDDQALCVLVAGGDGDMLLGHEPREGGRGKRLGACRRCHGVSGLFCRAPGAVCRVEEGRSWRLRQGSRESLVLSRHAAPGHQRHSKRGQASSQDRHGQLLEPAFQGIYAKGKRQLFLFPVFSHQRRRQHRGEERLQADELLDSRAMQPSNPEGLKRRDDTVRRVRAPHATSPTVGGLFGAQHAPEQHVKDGRRPQDISNDIGATYEVACRRAGQEKKTCCWRLAKRRRGLWIGTLAEKAASPGWQWMAGAFPACNSGRKKHVGDPANDVLGFGRGRGYTKSYKQSREPQNIREKREVEGREKEDFTAAGYDGEGIRRRMRKRDFFLSTFANPPTRGAVDCLH